MTLPDCVNKVNFVAGGGASNELTRISHSEARNVAREDRKEKGGTWNSCALFDLGCVERRALAACIFDKKGKGEVHLVPPPLLL